MKLAEKSDDMMAAIQKMECALKSDDKEMCELSLGTLKQILEDNDGDI